MSEKQPQEYPFSEPTKHELDQLCELVRQEKVVIWVGSGFSSYAGYPPGSELPSLLLESLGEEPGETSNTSPLSLKEVADQYVATKGRESLVAQLEQHYGKIPEGDEVHRSLARINRIKYIITTNYDPLFEHAYGGGMIAISHDEELPQISDNHDKTFLMKIHGDLSDHDSIVITSNDYQKFDQDSIVWNKIKSLCAEYSVVFIGYSIGDPNIKEMLADIYNRIGSQKHPYFFISRKIDEDKKNALDEYDLHFIEANAATAIDYITENVVQYAVVDGLKKSTILGKSENIFEEQGIDIECTSKGGKITKTNITPTRSDVKSKLTLTLKSNSKDAGKIHELNDLITGLKCDPVTIESPDYDIEIHNVTMNGVYLIDPSLTKLNELEIRLKLVNEMLVDIQSPDDDFRLSNLIAQVYGSPKFFKFEIIDPGFQLSVELSGTTSEKTVHFTANHIQTDIDRACIIWGILSAWAQGKTIELLSSSLPSPLLIGDPKLNISQADSDEIHAICQIYSDIKEIQSRFSVKFQLSDEITIDELKKIKWVSEFIRGQPQILDNVTITIENTSEVRERLSEKDTGFIKSSGEMWCEVALFGKSLLVPFEVIGYDTRTINEEEILAAINRGDQDLVIKLKSDTGKLFRKISHTEISPSSINGSKPLNALKRTDG